MFNLFKKKKPKANLKWFRLATPDWSLEGQSKTHLTWFHKEHPLGMQLDFFDAEPDLPTMKDIGRLRNFYRDLLEKGGGGVVEVEFRELHGIKVVRTIFKFPQKPSGMVYLGSFTIPFKNCSFVLKLNAPEIGTTGLRDSIIASEMMESGKLKSTESGFEGWFVDPYDPNVEAKVRMNLSERQEFDERFPEHPLSLTRKFLDSLEKEIGFYEPLLEVPRFGK